VVTIEPPTFVLLKLNFAQSVFLCSHAYHNNAPVAPVCRQILAQRHYAKFYKNVLIGSEVFVAGRRTERPGETNGCIFKLLIPKALKTYNDN
jgi:hypothetical protein